MTIRYGSVVRQNLIVFWVEACYYNKYIWESVYSLRGSVSFDRT